METFSYNYNRVGSQFRIDDQAGLPIVSLDDEATAQTVVEHLNSDDTGYKGHGDMAFNFNIFDARKNLIVVVKGMAPATKLIAHLNRDV